MKRVGLKAGSKVISQNLVQADEHLRRTLALRPGESVAVVTRLRLADGEALMLERSHIPSKLAPELLEHDLSRSLYELLTQTYGLTLAKGEESLEIGWADKKTAKLLGLKKGDALLYTRRLVTDEQGAPIEYAERYARADRCKFTVSLTGERADFVVKDRAD